MNQQPGSSPSRSPETGGTRSPLGRIVAFVGRHPGGVIQFVLFSLLGTIILQNVEPTSIDVLFWSTAPFPKLLLIFVSMLVGAASWELVRRRRRR